MWSGAETMCVESVHICVIPYISVIVWDNDTNMRNHTNVDDEENWNTSHLCNTQFVCST